MAYEKTATSAVTAGRRWPAALSSPPPEDGSAAKIVEWWRCWRRMGTKCLGLSRQACVGAAACLLAVMASDKVVIAQTSNKINQTHEQEIKFGGTYAGLKPAQRRLVDEWFRQYNEIAKRSLRPADEYAALSLSTRTTLEAVTHALMTSKLTGQDNRPLGTALDLISYVETIHGKIPKAGGDLQFRIYAALKPDALRTLESSREFKRDRDNTIYHKGYPLNYRQAGGVPSIQISAAKDGARADIDVDYRSAKFPAALYNGHLSSANSDVRAGGNHGRHVNRWAGFADWWKNVFGVSLREDDIRDEDLRGKRGRLPRFPRSGKGKLQDAVHDFLNSWLVEREPEQAAAYLSPRAYPCVEQVASDERRRINPGLLPYLILAEMKSANRALGGPARLSEAAESVRPDDPALRSVDQPHRAEFALFETPEDLAFDFECSNRNAFRGAAAAKKPVRKYGKYFGASLSLKTSRAKGPTLLLLWAKESGYWKVISWNVDSDITASRNAPSAAAARAAAETEIERVAGDPGMVAAAEDFFNKWFVEQNFDLAAEYFSRQSYPCVNLYLSEGKNKARNWPEARRRIRDGMKSAAGVIGQKGEVAEAIRGVVPAHPSLKLVSHSREQAYSLVSLPDEMATVFKCSSQVRGVNAAHKVGESATYGDYYGAILELKVEGNPAELNLLWGREKGRWKIIAYSIELP